MREKDIQNQILDYLALKKAWAIRMNTGAAVYEANGKKRFVRYGSVGLPDIVAFTKDSIIWIEVKSERGRLSPGQKEFREKAEKHGHIYIVARSLDDIIPLFGR